MTPVAAIGFPTPRVDPGIFGFPEELRSNQSLDSGSRFADPISHPGFEALGAARFPGVLVAVVFAIIVTVFFDLPAKGVATVGVLPQGFPLPSFPKVELSALPLLIGTAFGISLVAVGDTISTSAGFAARRGYDVDGDQELVGIGSANLLAGLFQGFPVSTSGSRTAVAEQAGAKSQFTGVVAAVLVLAMLLFVPGLVKNMPQSALAAIIIAASLSLFDVGELRRVWSVRRSEFVLAVASILGVALVGVLEGIVIAVLISIFQFFERAWIGSPFGLSLRCIRENMVRTQFVGIDVRSHRLKVFIFAGFFAGLAGVLHAPFTRTVVPQMANWLSSGNAVFMGILGGPSHLLGPIVGATVWVFLDAFVSGFTEHWPLIIGTIVFFIVFFMPGGLTNLIGASREGAKRAE